MQKNFPASGRVIHRLLVTLAEPAVADVFPAGVAEAAGIVVLHAPNPMRDNGGAQRAAQLARAFLDRSWAVVYSSGGEVTESVDLQLAWSNPGLVEWTTRTSGWRLPAMHHELPAKRMVITQVASRRWNRALKHFRKAGFTLVYDLIDNWHSELGYPWFSDRTEAKVVKRSQHVTASSQVLSRVLQTRYKCNPVLIPNAFDDALFQRQMRDRPPDLPAGRFVAMYAGALWGSWFDWPLVKELALASPEILFVFVGDSSHTRPVLPPNCHFPGLKAQKAIPAYLAAADCAIMPWKKDAITQATSPLQVYEYLAMGLPVVAPDIEPLHDMPGLYLAGNSEDFHRFLRNRDMQKALQSNPVEISAFLAQNSWQRRVDSFLDLVKG